MASARGVPNRSAQCAQLAQARGEEGGEGEARGADRERGHDDPEALARGLRPRVRARGGAAGEVLQRPPGAVHPPAGARARASVSGFGDLSQEGFILVKVIGCEN